MDSERDCLSRIPRWYITVVYHVIKRRNQSEFENFRRDLDHQASSGVKFIPYIFSYPYESVVSKEFKIESSESYYIDCTLSEIKTKQRECSAPVHTVHSMKGSSRFQVPPVSPRGRIGFYFRSPILHTQKPINTLRCPETNEIMMPFILYISYP